MNFKVNIKTTVKKIALTLIVMAFLISTSAQLPAAKEIASKMRVGWNMGNTMEAICGETVWGGAITTQRFIDSVKAAGFNAVRIPCAWFCHSDTVTSEIDADWLERVKEVVDYCINDDLYVVLNIHWDKGWLENRVNAANQDIVNERQEKYWTQIAEYFIDYDEHLLFAGANEPNVENAAQMSILMGYYQTFIDAVRATGGNNSSRTLIIQGPSTDIDKTNKLMNTMPNDEIEDRLMVEVHYYTPWQFCGLESDADWGKAFYYWGKDNHSKTDASRNSTWGEEKDVEKLFGMMKTKFVDKGIPVIIGEYMAIRRKLKEPSDQALHDASVKYFYEYIVKSALNKGIIPFCWDLNKQLFNRSTGEILDLEIYNSIFEGVKAVETSFVPSIKNTMNLYPNPFNNFISIKTDNPKIINKIEVYDIMGRKIDTIKNNDKKSSLSLGYNLKPQMYYVQVYGDDFIKTFKVLKNSN